MKKVHVLVQHKVKNFEAWKEIFQKNEVRWETAGMNLLQCYRSADDSRRVTLLFEVEDIIMMHLHLVGFIEKMQADGIIGAIKYELLEVETLQMQASV